MSRVRLHPSEPRSLSRSLAGSAEDLRAAFLALKTERDVARLLDVPYWQLTYLLHRAPADQRYTAVEIKKRSGGTRHLLVPCAGLAAVQRKLVQVLSAVYAPKPCVHGFVKNRSIVSNAKQHVRRSWVLNVDLQDFFPTIHFGRVRGVFRAKPYELPDAAATTLAQICCHANQLPQGAPTSPPCVRIVVTPLDPANPDRRAV
jgi:RNA-directed DNA polymerase